MTEATRVRRLLIAASTLADAEAALVYAGAIAEWSFAAPTGLLIETGTADFATGAGHRVVSSTGALMAVPSREQAQAIVRSEARILEERLARLAETLSTGWTCDVEAGEVVACACAAVSGDDILLLGQRPLLAGRGSVLLLGGEGGASKAARALAEVMARATASTISELQLTGPDLLTRIDRLHCAAVVADVATGPLTTEAELIRLAAAARCPVAILGARHLGERP